jgi:hypothetical protein
MHKFGQFFEVSRRKTGSTVLKKGKILATEEFVCC